MKNYVRRGVSLVSAMAVSLAVFPATSQTVGVNTAVRNIVKVKANAAASAVNARVKDRVSQGNDIVTAPASTLQILLLDQSSLTVGPNGRLIVDRFIYDPNRRASAVGVSIVKGAFRFLSGKSTHANPGQTTLRTPIASIGIRGTMVEGQVGQIAANVTKGESGIKGAGAVDPKTASLIVLRGPGPNTVSGETPGEITVTSGGKTVTIKTPGQSVFVPRNGAAPIVFSLSVLGYQSFDSALRTSPSSKSSVQRQQNQQARSNAQSPIRTASRNTEPTSKSAHGLEIGLAAAGAAAVGIIIAVSGKSDKEGQRAASPF